MTIGKFSLIITILFTHLSLQVGRQVLPGVRPSHQLQEVQLQAAPQDPHRGEALRVPGVQQGLQTEGAHGE